MSLCSSDVIDINLDTNWNGCSLFGVILGFPSVYYFDTDCGNKNFLSYVELVQIKAFQKNKLVSSFTVPEEIFKGSQDTKQIIEKWKENFEQTQEDIVIFPFVAM